MTEELLNALKLIKSECEKQTKTKGRLSNCDNCPLSTSDCDCGVMQLEPSAWSLQKREVYF